MTISKQRLNEIVLEVAKTFIREMEGYSYFGSNPGIPEDDVTDFALALIRRVESECGMTALIDGKEHFIKISLVSEE
mgnify:CR=1 FL=1